MLGGDEGVGFEEAEEVGEGNGVDLVDGREGGGQDQGRMIM